MKKSVCQISQNTVCYTCPNWNPIPFSTALPLPQGAVPLYPSHKRQFRFTPPTRGSSALPLLQGAVPLYPSHKGQFRFTPPTRGSSTLPLPQGAVSSEPLCSCRRHDELEQKKVIYLAVELLGRNQSTKEEPTKTDKVILEARNSCERTGTTAIRSVRMSL